MAPTRPLIAAAALLPLLLPGAAAAGPAGAVDTAPVSVSPAQRRTPPAGPFSPAVQELLREDHPVIRSSAPRDPYGHPDLTGYWGNTRGTRPIGNIGKDLPGFQLPYTKAGEVAHRHNMTQTIDPEGLCLPSGIPRQSASALPFAIVQSRNLITFLYWQNNYRVVFLDGRGHPDDPTPQFFGHAVGWWDGGTLVIDSTGFKDSISSETWADENADAHSDALHTVERWTRIDATHLQHEIVIDDPKYYTHPFKYTRVYTVLPAGRDLGEYICDENNLDRAHLQPGPGPIRPDGTRGFDVGALPQNPPPPEFYQRATGRIGK